MEDYDVNEHQESGIHSSAGNNAINQIFATAVTSPTSNSTDNIKDLTSESDREVECAFSSRRSFSTVYLHKPSQIIPRKRKWTLKYSLKLILVL